MPAHSPNTLLVHPDTLEASFKTPPYVPHCLLCRVCRKTRQGKRRVKMHRDTEQYLLIARAQEEACLSALFLALVVDSLDCSYLQPVDSLQKLLDFDLES